MNDSEFKYLRELLSDIGVNVADHMPSFKHMDMGDIIITGLTITVRKQFLKECLSLIYLAHTVHKKPRPIWMKKLRLLL